MFSRTFLPLILAVASAGFLNLASAAVQGALPTVILLTTDDMNWDSVGAYGAPVKDATPNVDRLAQDSIRFRYAFAQASVCTPSRHVMLSGCHSFITQTEGFVDIQPVAATLPEILKKNGYYTAIINKGVNQYQWDFQADRKETNDGRDPAIYARMTRQVYETAKKEGKPLFLMANTMDPHRPFANSAEQMQWSEIAKIIPLLKQPSKVYQPDEVPVPGFLPDLPDVRQDMADYYSSVRRSDDVVGEIIETLKELGIEKDVLLFFLSDQGISMPYAKANVYRNSLRIPLMVKLPGEAEAGKVVKDSLVSLVDLAPTVLDLLGLPVPEKMQGRSFKKLLLDGENVEEWRYVFGYFFQGTTPGRTPMFTVQDERYGYIVNLYYGTGKRVENSDFGSGLTWKAMVEAAKTDPEIAKRVEYHRNRALEELYDYAEDPDAQHNLIDDPKYAEVRERLTKKLEEWMAKTGCDALEAFRYRDDLAAREAYVKAQDAESMDRGGGQAARPVKYESGTFAGKEASWSPEKTDGVYPVQPRDGQTEMVEIDSRPALHALKKAKNQDNPFAYFHVHDGLTETEQVSYPMTVRLTLCDTTAGKVLVQYAGYQDSYQNTSAQALTGDGQWKTLEFQIRDARFDNSQHGGADLRVAGKDGAELYLDKVEVERTF